MYLDDKLYYTSFIAYNPLPFLVELYMCKVSLLPTKTPDCWFSDSPWNPDVVSQHGIISEKVEHGIPSGNLT